MNLLSIQVGRPQTLDPVEGESSTQPWTTGFIKAPASGRIHVSATNLAGDGQADLRVHGGPEKAICCYPSEHLRIWESELGLVLPHGSFGENFTTAGAREADVCIGDIFSGGTALLQISQPRQPCWKLARRWGIKDLPARVERTGRTGWYFRVLREGELEAPTMLELRERPHPEWTLSAANEIMHHRQADRTAAAQLAACPALSTSWKATLSARASTGAIASTAPRITGGR